jgi:hypothetical protein
MKLKYIVLQTVGQSQGGRGERKLSRVCLAFVPLVVNRLGLMLESQEFNHEGHKGTRRTFNSTR